MEYSLANGWKWLNDKEASRELQEIHLESQHKLLLVSDGSLTRFLEVLNRAPVDVEIKSHKTRAIEKEESDYLEVATGQDAIVREVWLIQSGKRIVYALSVFPVAGHDKGLLEKISTSIEPLGKSLTSQGLLTSKDKIEISAVRSAYINRTLMLNPETILWAKHYRLLAQSSPDEPGIVASITEIFMPGLIGMPPVR